MAKDTKAKTQPVSVRLDSKLVDEISLDGVPISRVIEVALRQWSENNQDEKKALLIEYIEEKTWASAGQALGIAVDKKTLAGLPLVTLGLLLTPGIGAVLTTLGGPALVSGGAGFASKAIQGLGNLVEIVMKKGKD